MANREITKKIDDFYEKLLVKLLIYVIIIFVRRKPEKCTRRVRQKTVPSNHRSFLGGAALFHTEGRECHDRIETSCYSLTCAGRGLSYGGFCSRMHTGLRTKTLARCHWRTVCDIFDFVRCRTLRQMGNVKMQKCKPIK